MLNCRLLKPKAFHIFLQDLTRVHLYHSENAPIQYSATFHGCKNEDFWMKNCDMFLIFAQNIDCEYTF